MAAATIITLIRWCAAVTVSCPSDIYVPGCPLTAEALLYGVMRLPAGEDESIDAVVCHLPHRKRIIASDHAKGAAACLFLGAERTSRSQAATSESDPFATSAPRASSIHGLQRQLLTLLRHAEQRRGRPPIGEDRK